MGRRGSSEDSRDRGRGRRDDDKDRRRDRDDSRSKGRRRRDSSEDSRDRRRRDGSRDRRRRSDSRSDSRGRGGGGGGKISLAEYVERNKLGGREEDRLRELSPDHLERVLARGDLSKEAVGMSYQMSVLENRIEAEAKKHRFSRDGNAERKGRWGHRPG
eukprot:TRINITY_DN70270_c0_g1_i1.p1 TRINITY_DN70270_c0_g1~~TRINITY_DN70270_c0_g1_i1.p1  ORF type:complete len:159 (+),score=47.88 TRINITY_DN70270_c0_g1_i1:88-564(+)